MKIIWNQGQIMAAVESAAGKATKEGAGIIQENAIRTLQQNIDNTIDSESTGALEDTIASKPSKFKNGGWIVGVFADPGGEWERTLGARAVFVEYGHAFPAQGRKNLSRKNIMKSVPARPFLRPALKKSKRAINKIFQEEINKGLK